MATAPTPWPARQFFHEFGEKFRFTITRVTGLTDGDEVSKELRPFRQMTERLNRTYKASYRPANGFDSIDGAPGYDLALWGACYSFLRPRQHHTIPNQKTKPKRQALWENPKV